MWTPRKLKYRVFYPRDASGKTQMYEDLRVQYHITVCVADAPSDRKFWDQPATTNEDVQDIIALIKTLSDHYKVGG